MANREILAVVWIDGSLGGIPLSLEYNTKEKCISRAAEMRALNSLACQHVRAVHLSPDNKLTYLD